MLRGTNVRDTWGAYIVAGACFGCAIVFLGCAFAYMLAFNEPVYYHEYLAWGWLCVAGGFTCIYLVLRRKARPVINKRKAMVHVLFADFLIVPLAVMYPIVISPFFLPVEAGILLLIWFLLYELVYRYPPGQRRETLAMNLDAFLAPLLLIWMPGFVVILELAVLGYWVAANPLKVTRHARTGASALLLAAGLMISPLLLDHFIVSSAYSLDISYNLQEGVPASIIPLVEDANLTSLFQPFDSPMSYRYPVPTVLRDLRNAFLYTEQRYNPFMYTWFMSETACYTFTARILTNGLNFTYWHDALSENNASAVDQNGSVLFRPGTNTFTSLYVNQSVFPPPVANPRTEVYPGTIFIVRVHAYLDYGGISDGETWFLVSSQQYIVAVVFFQLELVLT